MSLEDVDLSDRSVFRAGFPHELFARLRCEAPVWRHPDTPGVRDAVGEPGFWVVSSHDGGAHYCLGSHLAQRQVRVLFEELFAAARVIEPTGAPHWTVSGLHNNVPCSLGSVPIRVSA